MFREIPIFKKHGLCLLTATFLTAFVASDAPAWAALTDASDGSLYQNGIPEFPDQNDQPVDLEADNLIHDEGTQTVTAKGNVELVQAGRIVKADAISYNLQTEQVHATGNVVMSEPDGTTYFAEGVELTQDMKNGFVEGLQILLADGSRFTAEEGKRTGGTVIELKRATYTPCEPCKENPERPPLWQLRADKVRHDEADHKITYRDAWFEFAGVPLMYTPYFSHPDGTEKQKSGFLTPTFGYDSELGASYSQEYYYAISPDKDATIGMVALTSANPVAMGEYRQRFENAEIKLNGSGTVSDRSDSTGGITVTREDETRGHLFADGVWDMDENWRSGVRVAVASDEQYLRQYNIDSDSVLENEIYAERFSGRNYLVGRAMAFQDIRVGNRKVDDQPAVLPEAIASFYGDPNGMLGGRWNAEMSALSLYRDGSGQDVARGTLELGWQRRFITGFGLVNKFDAQLRGDAYNVQDGNDFDADDSEENSVRAFALANYEVSYPFVKRFETSQMTIAPVASVTGITNVEDDIPNEDSQDFTLDASNIFESNRSPGYDLIEDDSRTTYGIRTGYYTDDGSRGEIFLGQSYRFDENDNSFNEGSGLSDQRSDYVGQISASIGETLDFDYRFQLDDDNFASQRHELDTMARFDRLELGALYFFINGLEGTDLDKSREQIRPLARLRFYDDWWMTGAARYDLGEDEGLRRAAYGVEYLGQCLTFSFIAERTLTDDDTGDSDTEIMFRIGFKNLGEFESSGISIGGSDNSDDEDDDDLVSTQASNN